MIRVAITPFMENDYQISKDGTIFQIKEDGTISKLAKIENGKVQVSGESAAPPQSNTNGNAVLILFLVIFAIASLVLGILYSEANSNYNGVLGREYSLKQKVSKLEENVASLQNQLEQSRNRVNAINMQSSGYVEAEPGETFRINYTISPSTAKNVIVKWSSTSPSIASIDANGVITAHKKGFTTIIARVDGVQAECELEVRMDTPTPSYSSSSSSTSSSSSYQSSGSYNNSSSSYTGNNSSTYSSTPMSISKTSLSMTVGQRATLAAYNYGSSISWESDNTRVATVDSRGQVTAIGPGTTNIWAKGKEYKRCTVTVRSTSSYSNSNASTSSSTPMSISKTSLSMTVGQRATLTAYNYGSSISWESDNTRVATVDSRGQVTAIGPGTTFIWAKGKEYKRCTVTVGSNSSSRNTSGPKTAYPGDVYLSIGQSAQLKSLEGTITKWESDNSRVATVTSTGVVRAVGRGETNIWGYINGSPKRFFIHVN